jgi:hypothetical protein
VSFNAIGFSWLGKPNVQGRTAESWHPEVVKMTIILRKLTMQFKEPFRKTEGVPRFFSIVGNLSHGVAVYTLSWELTG